MGWQYLGDMWRSGHSCGMAGHRDDGPVYAQFVLFDGFDPLDVTAPFEVLAAGSDATGGELVVELVSAEGSRPVVSGTRGMVMHATSKLDPARPGFIVVPGASGPIDGDPDLVDTIPVLLARFGESAAIPLLGKAMANPDITVATVCGGSLALAMAGLLEGRNAVTHHLGMGLLEATGVNTVNARVVDDGDLVTCGAVTSGLDLALHLLDRTYGPRVALAVEELFAYERRGTVWTN
jgi:transcriptional regulator GlxA family with amidase domain